MMKVMRHKEKRGNRPKSRNRTNSKRKPRKPSTSNSHGTSMGPGKTTPLWKKLFSYLPLLIIIVFVPIFIHWFVANPKSSGQIEDIDKRFKDLDEKLIKSDKKLKAMSIEVQDLRRIFLSESTSFFTEFRNKSQFDINNITYDENFQIDEKDVKKLKTLLYRENVYKCKNIMNTSMGIGNIMNILNTTASFENEIWSKMTKVFYESEIEWRTKSINALKTSKLFTNDLALRYFTHLSNLIQTFRKIIENSRKEFKRDREKQIELMDDYQKFHTISILSIFATSCVIGISLCVIRFLLMSEKVNAKSVFWIILCELFLSIIITIGLVVVIVLSNLAIMKIETNCQSPFEKAKIQDFSRNFEDKDVFFRDVFDSCKNTETLFETLKLYIDSPKIIKNLKKYHEEIENFMEFYKHPNFESMFDSYDEQIKKLVEIHQQFMIIEKNTCISNSTRKLVISVGEQMVEWISFRKNYISEHRQVVTDWIEIITYMTEFLDDLFRKSEKTAGEAVNSYNEFIRGCDIDCQTLNNVLFLNQTCADSIQKLEMAVIFGYIYSCIEYVLLVLVCLIIGKESYTMKGKNKELKETLKHEKAYSPKIKNERTIDNGNRKIEKTLEDDEKERKPRIVRKYKNVTTEGKTQIMYLTEDEMRKFEKFNDGLKENEMKDYNHDNYKKVQPLKFKANYAKEDLKSSKEIGSSQTPFKVQYDPKENEIIGIGSEVDILEDSQNEEDNGFDEKD